MIYWTLLGVHVLLPHGARGQDPAATTELGAPPQLIVGSSPRLAVTDSTASPFGALLGPASFSTNRGMPSRIEGHLGAPLPWQERSSRSALSAMVAGSALGVTAGALGGLVVCHVAEAETDRHICALGGAAYALPVGAIAGLAVVDPSVRRGAQWGGLFGLGASIVASGVAARGERTFSPVAILLTSVAGAVLGGVVGGLLDTSDITAAAAVRPG